MGPQQAPEPKRTDKGAQSGQRSQFTLWCVLNLGVGFSVVLLPAFARWLSSEGHARFEHVFDYRDVSSFAVTLIVSTLIEAWARGRASRAGPVLAVLCFLFLLLSVAIYVKEPLSGTILDSAFRPKYLCISAMFAGCAVLICIGIQLITKRDKRK